jgi:hypothetical protein
VKRNIWKEAFIPAPVTIYYIYQNITGEKEFSEKNKNAPLEWDRFNHGRRVTPPSVRANHEPWR